MLNSEIIAVCCEIHTKQTDSVGRVQSICNDKVVRIVTTVRKVTDCVNQACQTRGPNLYKTRPSNFGFDLKI